jgi:protein-disulfide isomerase
MLSLRLAMPLFACLAINLNIAACRSPGDSESTPPPATPKDQKSVELAGIDTHDLTPREKAEWSALVSEQLAPCESVPVSVAECVATNRACAACLPAAEYMLGRVKLGMSRTQIAEGYAQRFTAKGFKEIELSGSPSRGPTDAPITVVEWADFECPACRAVSPDLEAALAKQTDVRFVFKNFPLDIHQNAEHAARASVAADLQGKFWQMHHELFTSEAPLTKERVLELAKKLGLDMARFEKDLRSEAVADAVRRDKKQGDAVDLRGTPTIYVNGRHFDFSADIGKEITEWFALERKLRPGKAEPKAPAPVAPTAAPVAPGAAAAPSPTAKATPDPAKAKGP